MNDIETAQLADNETAPTGRKQSSKRAKLKRLDFALGYLFSVLAACAIMMWSVFNTWLNVLTYRSTEAEEVATQDWRIAAIVISLTCVLPFIFGLLLLFKALGSTKIK